MPITNRSNCECGTRLEETPPAPASAPEPPWRLCPECGVQERVAQPHVHSFRGPAPSTAEMFTCSNCGLNCACIFKVDGKSLCGDCLVATRPASPEPPRSEVLTLDQKAILALTGQVDRLRADLLAAREEIERANEAWQDASGLGDDVSGFEYVTPESLRDYMEKRENLLDATEERARAAEAALKKAEEEREKFMALADEVEKRLAEDIERLSAWNDRLADQSSAHALRANAAQDRVAKLEKALREIAGPIEFGRTRAKALAKAALAQVKGGNL